ncbi:hypothetical protein [Streptomyces sp. NPDC093260]|uniref:hypothetical protein n=1 Tax=Streptomyces sp. NPDC093260 TaxID=3155073 RepID=UPI00343E1692
MTTRSSPPQPNLSVVVAEEAPWAGPPGGPAGDGEGEHADGEPAPAPDPAAPGTAVTPGPSSASAPAPGAAPATASGPSRAAVAEWPPEDVLRFVTLLERSPAVRAAVGARSADALAAGLVGRLARDPSGESSARQEQFPPGEEPMTGPTGVRGAEPGAGPRPPGEDRAPGPLRAEVAGRVAARLAFWPGWVAAAALVVCAAAHFPLRREGAPLPVYVLALLASGLCGALAVALVVRAGVVVLVAGSVVPAVLAGLGYVEGRFAPRELAQALSITVAPPASAGLTAVCASLASLAALSLLLMVHIAERHPTPRPGG